MDLSAATWRKSTRSNNMGGECVEVAVVRGCDAGVANKAAEDVVIVVRDTKNRDRAPHVFTISEWDAFLADAKEGRFDSAALLADLYTPTP
jgi:hypothetical protein